MNCYTGKNMDAKEARELLDVIDENDSVIGFSPMSDIYGKKLTHRIVHIFVMHPETSDIYLQQRALTKTFLPGYYCTSAGGHVRSGETYEEAAKRELAEELGIRGELTLVDTFTFTSNNHSRFIALFLTKSEGSFSFPDKEVVGGAFFPLFEANDFIARDENIHPQLKACFNRLVEKRIFDI